MLVRVAAIVIDEDWRRVHVARAKRRNDSAIRQAAHWGHLQYPHQLQLVGDVLGQVRQEEISGQLSLSFSLSLSSDRSSLSSGGSDWPAWEGGGGLTEISSNRRDLGRDNSPANIKNSNTKTSVKTVGGKENDLVDHKEGVKNIFQVCLSDFLTIK